MELLKPGLGLIMWTIISFIFLGIIVYAIYHLANNKTISASQKLLWLFFIILIPILGALIYLGSKKIEKAKTTV